jgi:hypothetical protein
MIRFAPAAATLALAATLASLPGATTDRARPQASRAASCVTSTSERIVAVGDVHGAFDTFVALLREAGIVDNRRRWAGGRTVFVQLGDVLDRGPDSRRVLDLIRQLERDAPKAGGRVVSLLGNHETMRMMLDLRYVTTAEYAAFREAGSADFRDRYFEAYSADRAAKARARNEPYNAAAVRKEFYDSTPLGALEMHLAFGRDGDYGKWLRAKDTIAIINGVAFVHGGVSLAAAALGCDGINARIRDEIDSVSITSPAAPTSFVAGPEGPLWHRGLIEGASERTVTAAELDEILKALGAHTIVVGHTVAPKVRTVQDGRVVQIDTGMLGGTFYPNGRASALEIANGAFTALSGGTREVVKTSAAGRAARPAARQQESSPGR